MLSENQLTKLEARCKKAGVEIVGLPARGLSQMKPGPVTVDGVLYSNYLSMSGEPRMQFLCKFQPRLLAEHWKQR